VVMQVLEVILILLAVSAGLRLLSIRLAVPQPVLLVLGGLLIAVTPWVPHFEPDPGVIFLVFIPPLLYRAALTTSLRDFKRNLRSISLLAFGLVLATMCAVAWAAHELIPGMSWPAGFVLGAIVSPPDAVSVTAITRRLKLPATIITILEGESLAVVSAGLYLGRQGPKIVSARTRIQASGMWEVLVFLLEGLIFILIGLELPVVLKSIGQYSFSSIAYYTLIISLVLVGIRLLWVFPSAFMPLLLRRFRGKEQHYPPWRSILFVGWAGMRGGDSLVIALTLPMATAAGSPFPARGLIILLTFGVILVSLIVQGLSLKPLIRLLNLAADGSADGEEANARLKSARAGIDRLNKLLGERKHPPATIEKLREKYLQRLKRLEENVQRERPEADTSLDADLKYFRLEMIAAEREEVIRLRDNDEIGDDAMRIVQQDLDLEEVLLSANELDPEE
jgi:NhaP-type Na+/H+ or K+/H+ antiporter